MGKILRNSLLFILFCLLFYGLVLTRYSPQIFTNDLILENPKGFYDYAGVVNVRSRWSSGSGTIEQIAEAAKITGLKFVVLTDLNAHEDQMKQQGYYDNILLITGAEYKYLDSRLLNIDGQFFNPATGAGRQQILITDALNNSSREDARGLTILAHPLKPGYRWSGEFAPGLNGIEVFNLKSIWQKAWLTEQASFAWTLFIYPFNPTLALGRLFANSSKEEVRLWDQLNTQRRVIGYAGSAAEARVKILGKHWNIPSYETLFSIISNHLLLRSELTGQYEDDRKKILSALKRGQFYMSLDLLSNPKGFNAFIKNSRGEMFGLGETVRLKKDLELQVLLPSKPLVPFQVQVFRNGERLLTSNSTQTQLPIREVGQYRVMVRLKVFLPIPDGRIWIPWIYTNSMEVVD